MDQHTASANDTYDHIACGVLTAAQGVQLESLVDAPNGNRYIALIEGQYTTVHRLDMKLTSVVLRMSNAGIYYKAVYTCGCLMYLSFFQFKLLFEQCDKTLQFLAFRRIGVGYIVAGVAKSLDGDIPYGIIWLNLYRHAGNVEPMTCL